MASSNCDGPALRSGGSSLSWRSTSGTGVLTGPGPRQMPRWTKDKTKEGRKQGSGELFYNLLILLFSRRDSERETPADKLC
jgi:hypothetical protein